MGTFTPTSGVVVSGLGGDDAIEVQALGGLQVWIYGNAGNDSLTSLDGGAITDGGTGIDRLIGPDTTNLWDLTGTRSGLLNSQSFTNIENLSGGNGNDTFVFHDATDGFRTIAGRGGVDTMDYSAVSGPITVNLQSKTAAKLTSFASIESWVGTSAADTFVGDNLANAWYLTGPNTGNVRSIAFASFESLVGGTANDQFALTSPSAGLSGTLDGGGGTNTLVGADTTNTWDLTGTRSGLLNSLPFSNIDNFSGGNGNDTFIFHDATDGIGVIAGRGGTDTIDYSAVSGPITVNLQSKTAAKLTSFASIESWVGTSAADTFVGDNLANAWYLTGPNTGNVRSIAFASFESLVGGTANDQFALTSPSAGLSGTLDGGGGTNTLVGADTTNTWDLIGIRSGLLNSLPFSNIDNLSGGNGNDTFVFHDTADTFGLIKGRAGTDTLDYSALSGPVTIDLQNKTAPKLTSFLYMESVVGSASSTDTLRGPDQSSIWRITGTNSGTLGAMAFSSFENLAGGAAGDTFKLIGNGSVTGTLDGGGGRNVLDYSRYGTPGVNVNLRDGLGTAVGSGQSNVLANVDIVVGTSGNDTLVGNAGNNVLIGGAGKDILRGGAGRDLLFGGSGTDELHGGAGEDILVAGSTSYYDETTRSLNLSAIQAILDEWTRTDLGNAADPTGYLARVGHLLAGGGLNGANTLSASTVQQDATAVDQLFGDEDRDWFLASPEDQIPDRVTSGDATETLTGI